MCCTCVVLSRGIGLQQVQNVLCCMCCNGAHIQHIGLAAGRFALWGKIAIRRLPVGQRGEGEYAEGKTTEREDERVSVHEDGEEGGSGCQAADQGCSTGYSPGLLDVGRLSGYVASCFAVIW